MPGDLEGSPALTFAPLPPQHGTRVARTAFANATTRGDATRISALLYLVPPLAMVLAWAILGEAVTTLAFAGFALSAAGVYIVSRTARR